MIDEDLIVRLDERAAFRDPRVANVGYYVNDSCAVGPGRFKWFRNVRDLCDHMLCFELEQMPYEDELKDELRRQLVPILNDVAANGLTEEAREAINRVDFGYLVHWWGTLHDLLSGTESFSLETLGLFALRKGRGCAVAVDDMPAFLEFLRDSPRVPYSTYENDVGKEDATPFPRPYLSEDQ